MSSLFLYAGAVHAPTEPVGSSLFIYSLIKPTVDSGSSLHMYGNVINSPKQPKGSSLFLYGNTIIGDRSNVIHIALVVEDTSHATTKINGDLLVELGHTYDTILRSSVTATSLDAYDIIVSPRLDNDATFITFLKDYLNKGIHVLLGVTTGWANGSSSSSVPISMGMSTLDYLYNPCQDIKIIDDTHAITNAYTNGQMIEVYQSFTWMYGITNPTNGVIQLATDGATTGSTDINILPKGAGANAYQANLVHLSFFYGNGGYTVEGKDIINESLKWLVSGTPTEPQPTSKKLIMTNFF